MFEVACFIYGYHICHEIWEAVLGETLPCDREPTNERDRYAVAVKCAGMIVLIGPKLQHQHKK